MNRKPEFKDLSIVVLKEHEGTLNTQIFTLIMKILHNSHSIMLTAGQVQIKHRISCNPSNNPMRKAGFNSLFTGKTSPKQTTLA